MFYFGGRMSVLDSKANLTALENGDDFWLLVMFGPVGKVINYVWVLILAVPPIILMYFNLPPASWLIRKQVNFFVGHYNYHPKMTYLVLVVANFAVLLVPLLLISSIAKKLLGKKSAAPALLQATASWVCAVVIFILVMIGCSIGQRLAVEGICLLLTAFGLSLGIKALFEIRTPGAGGILAPGLAGIAGNGILLFILATNLYAAIPTKDRSSDVRQSAATSQVAVTPVPTPTGPPRLRSIMWVSTKPSAQLDNNWAFEGDHVRGYKVTKIGRDSVDLLTPEGASLKLVLDANI
jgi:hypothetical protein